MARRPTEARDARGCAQDAHLTRSRWSSMRSPRSSYVCRNRSGRSSSDGPCEKRKPGGSVSDLAAQSRRARTELLRAERTWSKRCRSGGREGRSQVSMRAPGHSGRRREREATHVAVLLDERAPAARVVVLGAKRRTGGLRVSPMPAAAPRDRARAARKSAPSQTPSPRTRPARGARPLRCHRHRILGEPRGKGGRGAMGRQRWPRPGWLSGAVASSRACGGRERGRTRADAPTTIAVGFEDFSDGMTVG